MIPDDRRTINDENLCSVLTYQPRNKISAGSLLDRAIVKIRRPLQSIDLNASGRVGNAPCNPARTEAADTRPLPASKDSMIMDIDSSAFLVHAPSSNSNSCTCCYDEAADDLRETALRDLRRKNIALSRERKRLKKVHFHKARSLQYLDKSEVEKQYFDTGVFIVPSTAEGTHSVQMQNSVKLTELNLRGYDNTDVADLNMTSVWRWSKADKSESQVFDEAADTARELGLRARRRQNMIKGYNRKMENPAEGIEGVDPESGLQAQRRINHDRMLKLVVKLDKKIEQIAEIKLRSQWFEDTFPSDNVSPAILPDSFDALPGSNSYPLQFCDLLGIDDLDEDFYDSIGTTGARPQGAQSYWKVLPSTFCAFLEEMMMLFIIDHNESMPAAARISASHSDAKDPSNCCEHFSSCYDSGKWLCVYRSTASCNPKTFP